jgi:hypothetical protein
MRILNRLLHALLGLAIAVGLAAAGGLMVAKRVRSGAWSMPNRADLVWVGTFLGQDAEPARVIYLHRGPLEVTGGIDYAPTRRSSIVPTGLKARLPGFRGSDRAWNQIVACVRDHFADFDVVVTDRPPRGDGHVLVAVGGRSGHLGIGDQRISGVAPFNGRVVPDPVVYAFSEQMGERPAAVCETIAHEVGHVYGLDHTYRCSDLMTHFNGCGPKQFRDLTVRCGEHDPRDCEGGIPTQNSYQRLMNVLGPARLPTS